MHKVQNARKRLRAPRFDRAARVRD